MSNLENEEIGNLVGFEASSEWKMSSADVNECRAEAGAAPDQGNFKLLSVPGKPNQFQIQTLNPPGMFLYVDDYTKDKVSFVNQIPPSNGKNCGVFEMIEEADHYKVKLDLQESEQFLTLFEDVPEASEAKVQTQSGGVGKTQKWKFVKGGSGTN